MTSKQSNMKQQIVKSELSHEQEISISHKLTPLSVKTLWNGYYQESRNSRVVEIRKRRQNEHQGSRKK